MGADANKLEDMSLKEFRENATQFNGLSAMEDTRAAYEVIKHIKEGKDPRETLGMYHDQFWLIEPAKLGEFMYVVRFKDQTYKRIEFFSGHEGTAFSGYICHYGYSPESEDGKLSELVRRFGETEKKIIEIRMRDDKQFLSEVMKNTDLQELILHNLRTRAEFLITRHRYYYESPFNPDVLVFAYPGQELSETEYTIATYIPRMRKDIYKMVGAIIEDYYNEMVF